MGNIIYTDESGLLKATKDFEEAAKTIGEMKTALDEKLQDFMSEMLGNALSPMDDCARQMNTDLDNTNDKFSAIAEELTFLRAARIGIDDELSTNAGRGK